MKFDYRALGRLKKGTLNRTEQAYSNWLEAKKRGGEILHYQFEAVKLRLADRTFYSPDFLVINKDLQVEIHEVKGFMTDDANVKIKVAAEQFPFFIFKVVRLKRNEWEITEV